MRPNYLAVGFAASLTLHAIVLPFVHREPTVTGIEPPLRILHRERMPTPPPTPPPTPTPAPTQRPTPPPNDKPQTPAPRADLRIHPPRQDAHPHGGQGEPGNTHVTGDPNGTPGDRGTAAPAATDGPGAAAAPATPVPTPHPTPTPLSCARPDVPAATIRAMDVETPQLAQQQGIFGTVQVVVSLDARSRVVATRVQSSPSALLNAAALATARGSQFRTEVKNCEPVAADYIFSVDFTSQ